MSDTYLIHYGVKGMKWGVRHDQPRGRFTYQTTKHTTNDGKQTTAIGYTKGNGNFTGVMVTKKQHGATKYQNADGTLTKAGLDKYYNEKGTINRAGIKAQKKAQSIRDTAKGNTGWQVGLLATRYYFGHDAHKWVQDMIHQQGNKTIAQMAKQGASVNSRKAVAGAYIAAMGAVRVSELYPAAATAYYKTRYKHDDNYRNRIDAAAKMKTRVPKNK